MEKIIVSDFLGFLERSGELLAYDVLFKVVAPDGSIAFTYSFSSFFDPAFSSFLRLYGSYEVICWSPSVYGILEVLIRAVNDEQF